MASKKKNEDKERGGLLNRIIYGQIVSSDFFARNWLTVCAAVAVIMLYITNKYNCQTKMEEIRRLETQLEIVKTERLRVKSVYMSTTRESSMRQLIDSLGLHLQVQEKPPFKLSKQ